MEANSLADTSFVESTMKDIFNRAQDKCHSLIKLSKEMNVIYKKMPLTDFFNEFTQWLCVPLRVVERYPAVERTFEFIVKFILSLQSNDANRPPISDNLSDDEGEMLHPFIIKLFEHFIQYSEAKEQAVRFRICYLLEKIIEQLDADVVIEDNLFEGLCKSLLKRTKDKSAMIRRQAILTLSKFQEPTCSTCPVIKEYLFHLRYDPQAEVRSAVLKAITPNSQTMIAIVESTRDQTESVRQVAYATVAERFHIRSLKIATRIRLLREGLNDRAESVQKVVKEVLIPAWMKCKDNNVLQLLKSLDVQDAVEVSEKTLKVVFDSLPPDEVLKSFSCLLEDKLIPKDQLDCESAFYWRYLVQYFKSLGDENALDAIMPDLPPLCAYIQSHVKEDSSEWDAEMKIEHSFISNQLLSLAAEYNLSDQGGRSCLEKMSCELLLLPNTDHLLIKNIVSCYCKTQQDPTSTLNGLMEIISEIREPTIAVSQTVSAEETRRRDVEIAKISVNLHELKEELEHCIEEQSFARAQEIKEKIAEVEEKKKSLIEKANTIPLSQEVRVEKNDPQTVHKCLTIACEMLREVNFTSLNPTLQSLMETLVLPGIQNEDPAVRNTAVEVLGFCCLLSKELSCSHFVLFLEISKIDIDLIQVTALKVIFDVFLLYGLELFASEDEKCDESFKEAGEKGSPDKDDSKTRAMQTTKKVVAYLSSRLDSESQDVRATTVEGIGKLMLHQRLYSPRLLAHLVLLWYNPATESETFIRNFIGMFLSAFAAGEQANLECIEEAFFPIVRTILRAPPSSPLSQVDVAIVMQFLLKLTALNLPSDRSQNQENLVHGHLAMKLCNEVLKNPSSYEIRSLCKGLSHLELSALSYSTLKDLASLTDEMQQKVKDRVPLRQIQKFANDLEDLVAKAAKKRSKNPTSGNDAIVTSNEMPVDEGLDDVLVERSQIDEASSTPSVPDSPDIIPETPIANIAAGKSSLPSTSSGSTTPDESTLKSAIAAHSQLPSISEDDESPLPIYSVESSAPSPSPVESSQTYTTDLNDDVSIDSFSSSQNSGSTVGRQAEPVRRSARKKAKKL